MCGCIEWIHATTLHNTRSFVIVVRGPGPLARMPFFEKLACRMEAAGPLVHNHESYGATEVEFRSCPK